MDKPIIKLSGELYAKSPTDSMDWAEEAAFGIFRKCVRNGSFYLDPSSASELGALIEARMDGYSDVNSAIQDLYKKFVQSEKSSGRSKP